MKIDPFNLTRVIPILSFVLLLSSCGNDDDVVIDPLEIPESYNFENVNYTGQSQRLAMMLELKNYMKTARTTGIALDANQLKAMYANDPANANWAGTYEESKQLKSKTFSNQQSVFDDLFEALAVTSESTVAGTKGQAGVVQSNDGNSNYLLGANGLDHAQLIEKGLMGACFYYQATSVYLGEERMNVDNETIEPGEGTAMEHHWDEAFGYFGVPKDFPTNLDGLVFWGEYSNQRNAVLGCNQTAMDALLKGRAAISANELDTRDEAIDEVREIWELIAVGSALHYLNETMGNFEDMAIRGHALSEGIGFVYGLQFNEAKRISNDQVNEILTLMAGSADFSTMDLYEVETVNLQAAKDKLAEYYGLEDKKDAF